MMKINKFSPRVGRTLLRIVVPLFVYMLTVVPPVAAQTELVVYTTVRSNEMTLFKREFEKEYPDVSIKWVRGSTRTITDRLLAERNEPMADVVWGLATTSLALLANGGYLQRYAPEGLDRLDPRYVDPRNRPPVWVGQRAWVASICYNTVEGKKKGLPVPKSWTDLTKKVYKNYVVMPNPNFSGTGYIDVSGWIQMWGERKAWKFMDRLHRNIAWYTRSGSKPCRQVASGKIPIGISFAYGGVRFKTKGAPLLIIAPEEGVGWDLESFGIVKNTKNLDAARQLADWSVTRNAQEIYSKNYAVVTMPGVAKPVKYFPKDITEKMIKNDFAWAAANRSRILKTWQSRYGAKTLQKK